MLILLESLLCRQKSWAGGFQDSQATLQGVMLPWTPGTYSGPGPATGEVYATPQKQFGAQVLEVAACSFLLEKSSTICATFSLLRIFWAEGRVIG